MLEEQEMGGVARSAVAQGVATCTTGTSTRQKALPLDGIGRPLLSDTLAGVVTADTLRHRALSRNGVLGRRWETKDGRSKRRESAPRWYPTG